MRNNLFNNLLGRSKANGKVTDDARQASPITIQFHPVEAEEMVNSLQLVHDHLLYYSSIPLEEDEKFALLQTKEIINKIKGGDHE